MKAFNGAGINNSERDEGATGLRGSEKSEGVSERVSESLAGDLREDPLCQKTGHRMHLSEVSGHSLRDPLRATLRVPSSSQSCGSRCPCVAP